MRVSLCRLFIVCACCVCFSVLSAYGDENERSVFALSLEELLDMRVTVASRRAESVREAPAVMTIVTRSDIEALGGRNLLDVINRLPSMQVLGHAGFYGNKVQIRAQPNSSQDRHTLILLNGRPVRENVNGGNNAYFYLGFPLSAIESLEIIRGPGSVLYGSNAFAAVINIKTRSTTSLTPVYGVGLTYGTHNTIDYNAYLMGSTSHDVHYLAAARISRSDGPRITWTDNAGRRDALRYSDDTDAIYFNVGNDVLQLQTAYHRYVPGTFGTLGTLTDEIFISEVEAFFADFGMSHDVSHDASVHLNLTLNTFDWYGSDDGSTFFARRRSQNLITEPMLRYEPIEDLNLVVGGTLEYDRFSGRELHDHSRYHQSVYTQADYWLSDWFKPLVGLQYNKTERVKGNYSPRLGVVMTPGNHWGLKLLYSEAYRRAFAAEGYLDSDFLLGDPELEPETIATYEAQINYQNSLGQIDLTYFHSKQEVIEVDGSVRPLAFINHPGSTTTHGLELTTMVRLGSHWKTMGSGMIQSTDYRIDDPLIDPNYPDYMIKGGFLGEYSGADIGIFNSYFSSGSWRHGAFNNLQVHGSFDVSRFLGVSRQQVILSLFVDNILDRKLSHYPSDVGEDEPLPHYYGRRVYATAGVKW